MSETKNIICLFVGILCFGIIGGIITFNAVEQRKKWMNGDIDGIQRVRVTTGGFSPRVEFITKEEHARLTEKGIVVGNTLRR